MQFFQHKEVEFAYRDNGQGPAIIFLHGFLENQQMWDGIIEALPATNRKITLDLPGHGRSGNLGYIHTMEEMAATVKALFDHLKLKKAFLMGHSMGGYVALAFAEKHPERVRGLILMNSSSRADSPQKKKDRERAIALVKENHRSFIRSAIPHLFRPKNRRLMRDTVNKVKEAALKTSKQGIIAALEGMKIRPDREVLLHFAPYRVLLVAAQNDPVFKFDSLQEQCKAGQVQSLITENGHMAHLEDFETLMPGLRRFIRNEGV